MLSPSASRPTPVTRVLIANHHTSALPVLAPAGADPSVDTPLIVLQSHDIVETVSVLETDQPDLLVFQPLTANLEGFEVQHVLDRVRALDGPRRATILVLQDGDELPRLLERSPGQVDDFILGPVEAAELSVRVAANRTRLELLRLLEAENLSLESVREDLEEEKKTLQKQTVTDFKTGLSNDRFFYQRLAEEVARSRRHGLSLSLIIFDFDNFKSINDEFDHTFGDFVLLAFAKKLLSVVRTIDISARLGGDEFALLLPNTDIEEASHLATRLLALVQGYRFEKDGRSTDLSLSMGIDSLEGSSDLESEQFLRRADQALIEAKKRGKNRICLYTEVSSSSSEPPPRSPVGEG